uniref:Inorganic phosphate transporter 1-11-like n=1 Tax=Cicer arietinum TaxID=3827 RepID=A0A1S2Z8H4_CICAR|nr:inorganic phosphate transporter 1-11-like [Cicer arietinum]
MNQILLFGQNSLNEDVNYALSIKDIYPSASGLVYKASKMNAIEEVFQLSRAMFVVALLTMIPGYWCTVFLIDKIGRFRIQLVGFLVMFACMWFLECKYRSFWGESECGKDAKYDYCKGNLIMFAILFGLTLFFANFGPNSTTSIVLAELFPARFRLTCHGISAAAGKSGAILGAFVVQSYIDSAHDKTKGIKKAIMALLVVNLLGFFCTFLVPETQGRSLEEISGEEKEFEENNTSSEVKNDEKEGTRNTSFELK